MQPTGTMKESAVLLSRQRGKEFSQKKNHTWSSWYQSHY